MSLYVTDPNNLRLEFTVDHPEVEQINSDQLTHAHAALQRWLAGDHTPNNNFRPHQEIGPNRLPGEAKDGAGHQAHSGIDTIID